MACKSQCNEGVDVLWWCMNAWMHEGKERTKIPEKLYYHIRFIIIRTGLAGYWGGSILRRTVPRLVFEESTILESRISCWAIDAVQKHRLTAIAEASVLKQPERPIIPECSAHHIGILRLEVHAADGDPLAVIEDLDATFARLSAVSESDVRSVSFSFRQVHEKPY